MIKLSVIVPVYNVEKYLQQCLDSIINQTLKDMEIICVNDGSTDGSLAILEEYAQKDNRVKIINKPNSGYGHTMNSGIDAASGEYIGIIESDDFIAEDMYQELYELAVKDDADVAKSNWFHYFSKDDSSRKRYKISKSRAFNVLNGKENKFLLRISPSVWSAIYKKDFLKSNNIRFLETAGASYQDISFSFKVYALAKRVVLTDKAYLYYRQDNENSSVNNKSKVYCICEEYNEIENFLNEYPDLKRSFYAQKNVNQFNSYEWNLGRLDEKFKPEFVEYFSGIFKEKLENKEISREFFASIPKCKLKKLVKNPQKFCSDMNKKSFLSRLSSLRKKIISLHIKDGSVELILFGKRIGDVNG